MEPKRFRSKDGPEAVIQRNFIAYLKQRGWWVERMIGNQLQRGVPDIYATHSKYGGRFIDLKVPGGGEFTAAQILKWPEWSKHGTPIWIITAATDEEYAKLFKPGNWREYWRDRYDTKRLALEADLQALFDEFEEYHGR